MKKKAVSPKIEKPKLSARLWDEGRAAAVIAALIISIISILSSGFLTRNADPRYVIEEARILSADDSELTDDPYVEGIMLGRQYVSAKVLTGKYAGRTFEITNTLSRFYNFHAQEGAKLLVSISEVDGSLYSVEIYGYSRSTFVYVLCALFFALLILVGRKKGAYSVVSLIFTLIMIIFYMIPRISEGSSPVFSAIVVAIATSLISIVLISGANKKSLAAILGLMLGVGIAGLVSVVAGHFGHVSGMNMAEAEEVVYLTNDMAIKVPELLFAGIIIASLGAVMDVGISIASSVFEVHSVNDKLTFGELYKSGMNIGRDVMGTMSNTLILAFAGGSLNMIIIIMLYRLPYVRLINLDILTSEVIQGLSGSVGVILTIPLTALFAAALITRERGK